jgi:hypothetical protein
MRKHKSGASKSLNVKLLEATELVPTFIYGKFALVRYCGFNHQDLLISQAEFSTR